MANPLGIRVAECPKCGTDVGDAHPYRRCVGCGEFLPQEILERLPLIKKTEQAQAESVAKEIAPVTPTIARSTSAWLVKDQRIQPLLDPTVVAWRFLVVQALIGGVPIVTRLFTSAKIQPLDILTLVAFACPLIAYSLLLQARSGSMVFFLRAFRSDLDSLRLRSALRAVLGPAHHLTGIRPPREHGFLPVRLVFTLRDGFRSLGSPFFELEADESNWMVRLLASYRDGRFVFIDLRDLTPFVEDEIRLSYLTFGLARCVFITDPKLQHEEACSIVSAIVGDSAMDPNYLMLLPYSDESTFEEIRNKVTAFLRVIPTTRTKVLQAAIDFASQKVSIQKWKTRFRDTERGRLIYILAIQAIFGFVTSIVAILILGPEKGDQLWSAILAILGSVIGFASFVGFFSALSRARKQVRFEREHEKILGRPLAGAWRVRFGYAFGSVGALLNLPLVNVLIWMTAWIWLCSLWPDKALSGEFTSDVAIYRFNPLGTFSKKDGFGRWRGIYTIHGQNIELHERFVPPDYSDRDALIAKALGADKALRELSESTEAENLSLRDVTKQGVRIENRLPEITDDSLRAEFYSDQSKLKDSSDHSIDDH